MKNERTVLLVDDEIKITQSLHAYLDKSGYDVLIANDGGTALKLFEENEVSLIILDLMLPDIMGEQICQAIRRQSRVPIIMLTAKAEEASVVYGLQIGADDYIVKPFSPRTVMAKVEAVLRRVESDELTSVPISYGNGYLTIDFKSSTVRRQGKTINLTPTEYKLLCTLAKAPNRVFTRDQLIIYALDGIFDGYDRSIDTYIKSLRAKIEPDRKKPQYVTTVHGIGYKFSPCSE